MLNRLMASGFLVVVACGGHKPADTTPDTTATTGEATPPTDNGGNMIPPEKADEITQDLKRKNMIISRCLAIAMENKDVPHGTHGRDLVRDLDLDRGSRDPRQGGQERHRGAGRDRLREETRPGDRVPDAAEGVRDLL